MVSQFLRQLGVRLGMFLIFRTPRITIPSYFTAILVDQAELATRARPDLVKYEGLATRARPTLVKYGGLVTRARQDLIKYDGLAIRARPDVVK